MTDYSELLEAGRVKRGRFSRQQVDSCLQIGRRDLKTAKAVIKTSPEWAFNIAYNAMHQIGRAFMLHSGCRRAGEHIMRPLYASWRSGSALTTRQFWL